MGVTGAASAQDVEAVIAEFTAAGYSMSSPHVPALGFSVSSQDDNRGGRKYIPSLETLIPLVRQAAGRVLPVIHFRTDNKNTLCGQVKKVFNSAYEEGKRGLYEEGLCRTLQLNWTSDPQLVSQLRTIKKDPELCEMQIILRLGRGDMRVRTNGEIAKEILKYGKTINYVIIAAEMTTGKFDLERVVSLYLELRKIRHLTVGFTGRFTGDNVEERVGALNDGIKTNSKPSETATMCINAKDGLMTDNVLDPQKFRAYLQALARVQP